MICRQRIRIGKKKGLGLRHGTHILGLDQQGTVLPCDEVGHQLPMLPGTNPERGWDVHIHIDMGEGPDLVPAAADLRRLSAWERESRKGRELVKIKIKE